MSSLSTQTEMSNRAYENALQNYYAGLAEGPDRDLGKEMRDQQSNELLDAFTAPIGAHFIDSGLENVKDYANNGVKKAVQRGVDLGKAGAKKAVRAAAEKAEFAVLICCDLMPFAPWNQYRVAGSNDSIFVLKIHCSLTLKDIVDFLARLMIVPLG